MRTQALLGLPIVFLSSGCTMGARLGPELRSQPNGPVLEARGTVLAGIGSAGSDRGSQLTLPASFSVGEAYHTAWTVPCGTSLNSHHSDSGPETISKLSYRAPSRCVSPLPGSSTLDPSTRNE